VFNRATTWTPARTFLALALGFGLLVAIVNPPFAVNDEDVHLARILELSQGRLLTRSDDTGEYHLVPSDYVELGSAYESIWPKAGGRVRVKKVWRQLTAPASKQIVRRKGRAGSYPPVMYVPHTIALWLVSRFDTSALVHLYAVRFASLLAYVWLSFLAVRASTQFQWPFFILGLTPMALTQAAAVSGDGLVNGLSLLCFALAGKGVAARTLVRSEAIGLLVATAMLTLCKPVYIVVLLCWPAIPWSGAKRMWLRWLFPLAGALIALGSYAGWMHLNRELKSPPGTYDAHAQLAWLLANYDQLPKIALRTFMLHGDELMIESVFVRNKISEVIRFTSALVFVLHTQVACATAWGSAVSTVSGGKVARYLTAAAFLIACLAIVAGIPSAFYVCCTRVGASSLRNLQGRYFIPAMPALLLALAFLGRPVFSRWLRARGGTKIIVAACLTNALCLFCLIGWHYFPSNVQWPF
jgi:uncharacterized membrane protein